MQKCTIRLPADVWERAKIRAIEERREFQAIVAEALAEYLAKPRQKKRG